MRYACTGLPPVVVHSAGGLVGWQAVCQDDGQELKPYGVVLTVGVAAAEPLVDHTKRKPQKEREQSKEREDKKDREHTKGSPLFKRQSTRHDGSTTLI